MENPIVKVEHLYHRYATQWAIEDISFEIDHVGDCRVAGIERGREVNHDEYYLRGIKADKWGSVYKRNQFVKGSDCSSEEYRFFTTETSSLSGSDGG